MPTHDDPYVAQLKARKRELQLQLKTINTEMASIRANYSQKLGKQSSGSQVVAARINRCICCNRKRNSFKPKYKRYKSR